MHILRFPKIRDTFLGSQKQGLWHFRVYIGVPPFGDTTICIHMYIYIYVYMYTYIHIYIYTQGLGFRVATHLLRKDII